MPRYIDPARYKDLKTLTGAARGTIPCDLVITNARIVDVITETTAPGEVWIKNGVIVHVERKAFGKFTAERVFDAKGAYLSPGLLDSHVHIESSMLSPYHFGRAVVVHGTTTVFTDPHEICNVTGIDGIDYMVQNSLQDPVIRQFILIPSCVPAVPSLESAGAEINAKEVAEIAGRFPEQVMGLAEIMDFIGVINADPRMTEILNAARERDLYLQAHYAGLHSRDLSAYLAAGIGGNHELTKADDIVELLQAGGWVDIRGGGSILDELDDMLPALGAFPNPSLLKVTVCTDDVHAADILDRVHGHVNKIVTRIIASGIKPETAIAYATRNPAQQYGIDNIGAIRAGNLADLILFDDFTTLEPTAVFVGGVQQVADGEIITPARPELAEPPPELRANITQTMRLDEVTPDALLPTHEGDTVLTNILVFTGEITTTLGQETLPLKDGKLDLSARDDLCYVAVCDRYGKGGVTVGVAQHYGLTRGAVATTVSHDSHNLTLVYKDPETAAFLANQLIQCGGGIAAARSGEDYRVLALPLGGLMSTLSAEELTPALHAVEEILPALFGGAETNLLKTAVLTLPVVPEIRVTNLGIVDTMQQTFIPLFP
ncbi:MAG: amidohydrolase family protein [Oscillospiraceae bacterium]|nr:amidohydrolase family protein [Oscillospiraceae bacterium]